MGETYDIGVRVGSTSDDAALEHFNQNLAKVLQESGQLSESLKALSNSFDKTDKGAKDAGDGVKDVGEKMDKAKGQAEGFGTSIKNAVLELFAVQRIWETLKSIFTSGLNEEKLAEGFTRAAKTMAGATDEEAHKLLEWVQATSLVAVKTKEESSRWWSAISASRGTRLRPKRLRTRPFGMRSKRTRTSRRSLRCRSGLCKLARPAVWIRTALRSRTS